MAMVIRSAHPQFIQFCPLSCLVLDIPATFDDIRMSIFQAEAEWIDGKGCLFAAFVGNALKVTGTNCTIS
ncbi:hypothetical protein QQP08_007083 [Theobroma cacao]|nr:hypothetical protein QQP08_007083 [Theobroma cacao]